MITSYFLISTNKERYLLSIYYIICNVKVTHVLNLKFRATIEEIRINNIINNNIPMLLAGNMNLK